jgi:hypothetical protein
MRSAEVIPAMAECAAGQLAFSCPTTGRSIATGIEMDAATRRSTWFEPVRLSCPHCGAEHEMSVSAAFIADASRPAADPNGRF